VPHFDPSVIEAMTHGSAQHDELLRFLRTPGHLTLWSEAGLAGASAAMTFTSDQPFEAAVGQFHADAAQNQDGRYRTKVDLDLRGEPQKFGVSLETRQSDALPKLDVTYTSDVSKAVRPVPLDALYEPPYPTERQPVVTTASPSPLTEGGNWEAGKALFFGDAKCSTCHTVRGEGGAVGPNLSHLNNVNPESVLQDIVEPSARINPDHVSYIIETKSGDTLSGLVRQEGQNVLVTEGVDKVTTLPANEVKEIRPSKISLMPEGYKDLGNEKLRDLLTFLTNEGPKGK
jgi:putative heme-binding domain-containing protein